MLEQKDLQAIADLIDSRVSKTEHLFKESENTIVNELVKTEDILTRRIEKIETNLEELNQYYKITRLENDNTSLLLRMIEELYKRVAELEKKTA